MLSRLDEGLEDKVKCLKMTHKGFPFMSCRTARTELYKEFGYSMVTGEYRGPFSEEYRKKAREIWNDLPQNFSKVPHDFSYDPQTGLFIDVTASQFHDSNPDIIVMAENDPRIALKYDELNNSTTHHVLQMYVLKNVQSYNITCIAPRDQKPKGMIN